MKPALTLLAAIFSQVSGYGQDVLASVSSRNPGLRIPADCNRPDLLANGYPVMVRMRSGVNIGISLAEHEFKPGEPIQLPIWVDNASDTRAGVFSCFDLEPFKRVGFQIFSRDGKRILSRSELDVRKECSTSPESVSSWGGAVACARNIMFTISAHSCVTHNSYDFTTDLTRSYELPPGEYVIRLRTDWRSGINVCKPESEAEFRVRQDDLRFTVTNERAFSQAR